MKKILFSLIFVLFILFMLPASAWPCDMLSGVPNGPYHKIDPILVIEYETKHAWRELVTLLEEEVRSHIHINYRDKKNHEFAYYRLFIYLVYCGRVKSAEEIYVRFQFQNQILWSREKVFQDVMQAGFFHLSRGRVEIARRIFDSAKIRDPSEDAKKNMARCIFDFAGQNDTPLSSKTDFYHLAAYFDPGLKKEILQIYDQACRQASTPASFALCLEYSSYFRK